MIHVTCDICKKEPDQGDEFMCDITKIEAEITMVNPAEGLAVPQKRNRKFVYQICKDCFYEHISKHLKND